MFPVDQGLIVVFYGWCESQSRWRLCQVRISLCLRVQLQMPIETWIIALAAFGQALCVDDVRQTLTIIQRHPDSCGCDISCMALGCG